MTQAVGPNGRGARPEQLAKSIEWRRQLGLLLGTKQLANHRPPLAAGNEIATKTSKIIKEIIMQLVRLKPSHGAKVLALVSTLLASIILLSTSCSSFVAAGMVKSPANNQEFVMEDQPATQAPVIGILTQVLRDYKRFTDTRHLHLAASYVKWIESSGGQVIPILLNKDDAYYERMFKQTNGLLLPGGDNLLDPHKDTPMMVASKKLYKLAVEANDRGDFYPIWGTCLGLELLSVLTADRNVLANCSTSDISLSMTFVDRGRLFAPASYSGINLGGDYSGAIADLLSRKNLTYHYHHKCLTDEGLERAGLQDFYRPLAYSQDKDGLQFINIFEAINYPFYGVQFHPEKPPFEYRIKKSQHHIGHSKEEIAVSRYFADFFLSQAQMNNHTPGPRKELETLFIYSYKPTYTGLMNDMYEQRYLFPYEDNGLTMEEFVEHKMKPHEEVPEDVTNDLDIKPGMFKSFHYGGLHSNDGQTAVTYQTVGSKFSNRRIFFRKSPKESGQT